MAVADEQDDGLDFLGELDELIAEYIETVVEGDYE